MRKKIEDMFCIRSKLLLFTISLAQIFLVISVAPVVGQLNLGSEELVKDDEGDIVVPGYSVPSFVHWDDDGLKDLVVGEGPTYLNFGKVRVYLNEGTSSYPQFSNYFYAQSNDSDLTVPGSW